METEYINAYDDDNCPECRQAKPCQICAETVYRGQKGPGIIDGERCLFVACTHPTTFRSMVAWWNDHPTIPVKLYLRARPANEFAFSFLDSNIVSLGLLNRHHVSYSKPNEPDYFQFFRDDGKKNIETDE